MQLLFLKDKTMKKVIAFIILGSSTINHAPQLTITEAGVYRLGSDITYNPTNTNDDIILINSSNVMLDLAGYTLSQGNSVAGLTGIEVAANTSNVYITNGVISNLTGTALAVDGGCSRIFIENITTFSCNVFGIFLNGTNSAIINCGITRCDLSNSTTAINIINISDTTIEHCSISSCSSSGIALSGCTDNFIRKCNIRDVVSSTGNAYGIISANGGSNNSIEQSLVKNILTQASSFSNQSAGIAFDATEANSKIIDCILSATTTLASNSLANTFGIQLQYSFTALSNSGQPTAAPGSTVNAVSWSSDKRYLAIAWGTSPQVIVYELVNAQLVEIASFAYGAAADDVAWSPDGKFLAVAGASSGSQVRVLEFYNGSSLIQHASFSTSGTADSIRWAPNGRLLAVGGTTSPQLEVIQFTPACPAPSTAGSLTSVATFAYGATINQVAWSPDGQYIVVGGATSGTIQVQIVSFSGTALTSVATFAHGATVNTVQFSPNERFIALAGATGTGSVEVRVLGFNGTTLSSIATFAHGATIHAVSWSPDGNYLVIAGATNNGSEINLLSFNEATLTQVSTFTNGTTVNATAWSSDGAAIAIGGQTTSSIQVRILTALTFSTHCIVTNNSIDNILGAPVTFGYSRGRGISASSDRNLIYMNTIFSNDLNIQFSDSVFSQYLANPKNPVPTLLSNFSFPPL
jgi:WD40 repeat protein